MNLVLTENTFFRKSDVTKNSAYAKHRLQYLQNAYFLGETTENAITTFINNYLVDLGMTAAQVSKYVNGLVARNLKSLYPTQYNLAKSSLNSGLNFLTFIQDEMSTSIYPKWEINFLYRSYTASTGEKLEIISGGTVTGYYTSTGQKITI